MRRARTLLPFLAGTLASVTACNAPGQPPARPRATYGTTTRDLGSVVSGTPLEAQFLVRNDGSGILRLERLRVAADCQASASQMQIPDGTTATLRLRCDSNRHAGKWQRTVTVYSNDSQQPVQTLAVTSLVQSAISVRPAAVYAGRVRPGDVLGEEVVVRGAGPGAGELRTEGAIDASWQSGNDGTTARIRVRISPTAPAGTLRGSLEIAGAGTRAGWSVPVVGIVERSPS